MKTTVLLTLLLAIVGRFMADEVKAWTGWLHKKLRLMAVAKLPLKCRERYDEEWESGLEEIPGEIFKLIYSVGLIGAALGIRSAAAKSATDSRATVIRAKRLFDFAVASFFLSFALPLFLFIAFAIRLTSRGPIFISSVRIGRRDRPFHKIHFRTMTSGKDPRITFVGRYLHIFHFDVLPEFINVLRGDMSLVGPRAPRLTK